MNPATIDRTLGRNPGERGYAPVYRQGASNFCPGCGRSHWYVGRSSAQCAFCETAIPFATALREFEVAA